MSSDYEGAIKVEGALTVSDGKIKITDGTNDLSITAGGAAKVEIQNPSITVTATGLDTRHLTSATDAVQVFGYNGTAQAQLQLDSANNLKVAIQPAALIAVCEYGESAADIAKNASYTFDYVIPSGKTFTGGTIQVGSSARAKVVFGIGGTTFTKKGVSFQQASVNVAAPIAGLSIVGDGTKTVRVIVTNLDNDTTIYVNVQGQLS